MKSFIRTIVVFVAVLLATGGFAFAQEAREKETQEVVKKPLPKQLQEDLELSQEYLAEVAPETDLPEIVKEALEKDPEGNLKRSVEYMKLLQKDTDAGKKGAEAKRKESDTWLREWWPHNMEGELLNDDLPEEFTKTLRHNSIGTILVIPNANVQIQEPNLFALMEDMNVMARILDKYLMVAHLFPRLVLAEYCPDYISRGNRPAEGIYLEGHGALFLMGVSFPFGCPIESEKKKTKQPQEHVDPIWQRTKRDLYTPKDIISDIDSDIHSAMDRSILGSPLAEKKDDVEKVEYLKKTLVKALKHAANIRDLPQQEWVTLVVRGYQPAVVIKRTVIKGTTGSKTLYEQPPRKVLIIRAKKSDIDAFSKGDLDFDQFRRRTQVFKYFSS